MAMNGRYPLPAIIAMGLIVLNILAWFVMLGGAAALQHSRHTVVTLLNRGNQFPGTVFAYGNLKPVSTNQNFISYQWFKAVLQILTLLGALAVTGMGMIHHGRVAIVGLLAIVTVFISDSADTFYYLYLETHKNPLVPHKERREVEAYFSGCVMCATLDFLILICLGIGSGEAATTNNYNNPTAAKDVGNGAHV